MSEYQYYHFQAIDRPLDERQMRALRKLTSRADITPTSLINEYHWGDFRGDPWELLKRYFDAFVYVANWGTCHFMFRVPLRLVDESAARAYASESAVVIRRTAEHLIVSLSADGEGGSENWYEPGGWMASLAPLRNELMAGDLRGLYLGWLVAVLQGEFEEDEPEPPVPPGLQKLTAAQTALAQFLLLDEDLLRTAAAGSGRKPSAPEPSRRDWQRWLSSLGTAEKDDLLLRVLENEAPNLRGELLRRFRTSEPHAPTDAAEPGRRRVDELLAEAERLREEAERREAERQAAAAEQRRREEQARREARLENLSKREPAAWEQVDTLIALKQPAKYDEAVSLLQDLREIARREGREDQTLLRIHTLHQEHARKPNFVQRLRAAGLV